MISDKRIDDIKAGKSEMFTLKDVAIQLGLKQMFKVIIQKLFLKNQKKLILQIDNQHLIKSKIQKMVTLKINIIAENSEIIIRLQSIRTVK